MKNIYMLGVGPGDPDLITLKALKILQQSDIVYVPESELGGKGAAESIISPHVSREKFRMAYFPMTNDEAEHSRRYNMLADEILQHINEGKKVAYVTLGDTMIYSTGYYVAEKLIDRGVTPQFIPGVTSYVACANRAGVTLASKGENVVITAIPTTAEEINKLAEQFSTVVLMKISKKFKILTQYVKSYHPQTATLVKRAYMEGEEVHDLTQNIPADDAAYLAVAIIKK